MSHIIVPLVIAALLLGVYVLIVRRWPDTSLIGACHHVDITDDVRRCHAHFRTHRPVRRLDGTWRLPDGWGYAEDMPTADGHAAMVCPAHAAHHRVGQGRPLDR
ncbi:hypothetical protein [Streptomyces sp. NPDC002851]